MRLETTIKRFIGNSTEQLPELEQRDAGSTVLLEDTGKVVRWTGKAWVPETHEESQAGLLREILHTLRDNHQELIAALD